MRKAKVPAAGQAPASAPVPKSRPAQPAVAYRLAGSVRVEGTGEPVPGAKFLVMLGDGGQNQQVTSGGDGRFDVELPPGQARSWTLMPPAGYWLPDNNGAIETFVLAPDHPVHRKDYVVRRGVAWPFRLTRGAARQPVRGGCVAGSTQKEYFLVEADETGLARLTLPPTAAGSPSTRCLIRPRGTSSRSRSSGRPGSAPMRSPR